MVRPSGVVLVLSVFLGELAGKDADHQPAAHPAAVIEGAHLPPDGEGAPLLQGQAGQLLLGGDYVEVVLRP